jgi:ATP phosphoribosyltransferase regulatory subunit
MTTLMKYATIPHIMSQNLTPKGIQDLNINETEEQQVAIKSIMKTFDALGYSKIKTPTIENYDSLAKGLGPLKNKAVKFLDPSGNTLVLRPDHTTPIARLIATRLKDETFPLKLSYADPVFRRSSSHFDGGLEQYQAGVEIIGDDSAQADADTITACIKALSNIPGLEFGIDIGHVNFTKGLSAEKRQALLEGDYLTFGEIPKRGDVSIVKKDERLAKIAPLLEGSNTDIAFNLGLVKDLDYYTGIIFEAYDKKSKQIIASGGRFDTLLEKFGENHPAVGFAIQVNHLQGLSS